MKNIVSIHGRVSRKFFWISFLVSILFVIILSACFVGALYLKGETSGITLANSQVTRVYQIIFAIGCMIPYCYMVSVLIRRFHDRNKKWNWVVLLLLPVIGPLWILVECGFLAGTKGRNDYGEDLLV